MKKDEKNGYERKKNEFNRIILRLFDDEIDSVDAASEISKIDKIRKISYNKRNSFAIYAGDDELDRTYHIDKNLVKRDRQKIGTALDEVAAILRMIACENNPNNNQSSVMLGQEASTKHHTVGYRRWEKKIVAIRGDKLAQYLPRAYERMLEEAR
jgi:beta-glucosidase-like glycosyl hydrolase